MLIYWDLGFVSDIFGVEQVLPKVKDHLICTLSEIGQGLIFKNRM